MPIELILIPNGKSSKNLWKILKLVGIIKTMLTINNKMIWFSINLTSYFTAIIWVNRMLLLMSFFWLGYIIIWPFGNVVIALRIMVTIIAPNRCEFSSTWVEISFIPLAISTTINLIVQRKLVHALRMFSPHFGWWVIVHVFES